MAKLRVSILIQVLSIGEIMNLNTKRQNRFINFFGYCIFFGIFILNLSFASPPCLNSEEPSKSVWMISNLFASGTAFAIDEHHVVTNFHFISFLLDTTLQNPDIFSLLETLIFENIILQQPQSSVNRDIKIKRVVAISAVYDLALLETEQVLADCLETEQELSPTEDLSILGYPNRSFKEIQQTGKGLSYLSGQYEFTVNHSSLLGTSGGPVLNSKNQVVGVIFGTNVNIAYMTTVEVLKEFMTGDIGLNCFQFESPGRCLKEEIENIKQESKQGNALVQHRLGVMYYNGEGTEKDLGEAFRWYKSSAEQGDTQVQYNLSVMYYNGEGTEKDLDEAFRWYKSSAEQGYAPAQFELGGMYYRGEGTEKDLGEAFRWYKSSAEQGDAPAQFELGLMYYRGEGTEKDLGETFKWFKSSAEQGYALAQYNLGVMYYNGEGTEKDLDEAFRWYKSSAEQGYAPAQFELGGMYYRGEGTEKDLDEAFKWFKSSAEQGYAPAQSIMRTIIEP